MPTENFKENYEYELTLEDIIKFLIDAWTLIFASIMFCLIAAVLFLWLSPRQFQAIAYIQIAQSARYAQSVDLDFVNVEEPAVLLARYKLPTTYSLDQITSCGLENKSQVLSELIPHLNFTILKGSESTIEVSVYRKSKEIALSCLQSVFDHIRSSQKLLIKSRIEEAKNMLIEHQHRLDYIKKNMLSAEKKGDLIVAEHIILRDEIIFLSEQIARLNLYIITMEKNEASLIAPIFTKDIPDLPNKKIAILYSLMCGVLVGLLLALIRRKFI